MPFSDRRPGMNLSDSSVSSNDTSSAVSTPPSSGVRLGTATRERSAAVHARAKRALLAFLAKYGFGQNDLPEKAQRFLNTWAQATAPLAFGRAVSAERVQERLGEHPLLGQPAFELHVPKDKARTARSCVIFVAMAKVNGQTVHQLATKTVEIYDDDLDDEDEDDEVN